MLTSLREIADVISIEQLRAAVPPHCFKPSLIQSSLYLLRDLLYSTILIGMLAFFLQFTSTQSSYRYLFYPVVSIYGFCQGIVWTGLWIIGHECGHGAFSSCKLVNNIVGWTIHTFLMTPYFSWQSTHRRHHIYANHITKDLTYVPPLRDEYAKNFGIAVERIEELVEDSPLVLLVRILIQQIIGFNWYLLSNITCSPDAVVKPGMSAWRQSHFDPWGSLFQKSEVKSVLLSDLGCVLQVLFLYWLKTFTGSFSLIFWGWLVPWLWVNHWIVIITYLHHTHPDVPKYRPEEWNFVLGATATIDRDFGLIGTHFFHHISSDHVTHHLFSKIPHYYAQEATAAIVPLLGNQYNKRGKLSWSELTLAFSKCQWVEEDVEKDRKFFKNGKKRALWYKSGPSPPVEYKVRTSIPECEKMGGNPQTDPHYNRNVSHPFEGFPQEDPSFVIQMGL